MEKNTSEGSAKTPSKVDAESEKTTKETKATGEKTSPSQKIAAVVVKLGLNKDVPTTENPEDNDSVKLNDINSEVWKNVTITDYKLSNRKPVPSKRANDSSSSDVTDSTTSGSESFCSTCTSDSSICSTCCSCDSYVSPSDNSDTSDSSDSSDSQTSSSSILTSNTDDTSDYNISSLEDTLQELSKQLEELIKINTELHSPAKKK